MQRDNAQSTFDVKPFFSFVVAGNAMDRTGTKSIGITMNQMNKRNGARGRSSVCFFVSPFFILFLPRCSRRNEQRTNGRVRLTGKIGKRIPRSECRFRGPFVNRAVGSAMVSARGNTLIDNYLPSSHPAVPASALLVLLFVLRPPTKLPLGYPSDSFSLPFSQLVARFPLTHSFNSGGCRD